jgi:hypothetical protein
MKAKTCLLQKFIQEAIDENFKHMMICPDMVPHLLER